MPFRKYMILMAGGPALSGVGLVIVTNAWRIVDAITPVADRDVNYYFGVTTTGVQLIGAALTVFGPLVLAIWFQRETTRPE